MKLMSTTWAHCCLVKQFFPCRHRSDKYPPPPPTVSQHAVHFCYSSFKHFIGQVFKYFRHYNYVKIVVAEWDLLTVPNSCLLSNTQFCPK